MTHVSVPDAPPGVHRIGLTGGIGSGKSTVGKIWAREGHHVIDLDALSRAVLDQPGDGLEEAIAYFGEEYRDSATGTADRAALAALVFNDSRARAELEEIVHRHLWAEVARLEKDLAETMAAGASLLVVHDSPLLFELGHDAHYEAIVVVLTPEGERIDRVVRERGKTREYVEGVIRAQVSDKERQARGDVFIDNAGAPEGLETRADAALASARRLIRDRLHALE
ncbi:dephospho-CoA kinase [Dermabacter sp. HSID17554]|uniref:dephospho-CoA kinase n=1 Tax=Dermabacter sp. HSID17554 TaxID=2419511 RepID=UPI000F8630EB|nr:dephospho-CoA kinase [Dermabacter sp. HSID17554]RUP87243.1 dephospho-CoA kinase [Dermabacter sp. HSID17554]